MPEQRRYFTFCEDNCKAETLTKEQIIAAIQEATGVTPTGIDDAFVTKIKERNRNANLRFWVGTQEEYNAIQTKENNCFYIITNESTIGDLQGEMQNLIAQFEAVQDSVGEVVTDVNAHSEEIQQLGTDIDNVSGNVSSVLVRMTGVEGNIDSLETAIAKFVKVIYNNSNGLTESQSATLTTSINDYTSFLITFMADKQYHILQAYRDGTKIVGTKADFSIGNGNYYMCMAHTKITASSDGKTITVNEVGEYGESNDHTWNVDHAIGWAVTKIVGII